MSRKFFVLAAATALATLGVFTVFCSAEQPPQPPSGAFALTLQAKKLDNAAPLAKSNTFYSLREVASGRRVFFSGTTAPDGSLTVYLDAGEWFIHAEADDIATPGKDFAAALTLKVSRDANQTIFFQRVASVSGVVTDENNESVGGALVQVNCLQEFYELAELNEETSLRFETASAFRADASGTFILKFAPVGACRFTATAPSVANESASELVQLAQGELASVALKIKRKQSGQPNYLALAVFALSLLLVVWFLREYLKKKRIGTKAREDEKVGEKQREKLAAPQEKKGLKTTKKMRDVMKALSERERRIVEVLIAHEGKLKQNKIFRETLIPKTSLSRALDSLERRNIVRLTPEGNTFLVELTEWFTSK
ncbi:MAG: hypothetical protein QW343_03865 [Candidatus Norongarragalinales archaeon]